MWVYIRVDQQWWQPGANTICYFPLTSDLLDASWNSYSLTASGSAAIWTIDWVDCLNCSASSSYVSWTISWIPQWQQARTNMCWIRWTISGNYPWWQYWSTWTWHADIILSNNWITWSQYWDAISSNQSATTGQWYHVAVTTSWGTVKIYVNWALKNSSSMTINTSWTTLYLGRGTWDNTYGRAYYSNMIIEDKTWTDQEIADYYNLTKSLYGIS